VRKFSEESGKENENTQLWSSMFFLKIVQFMR